MEANAFMQLAIDLADSCRYLAPPNPWVGCVIVKGGVIVGKGATEGPTSSSSGSHAEVQALKEAKDEAYGATCYVTLEPCSHHGRTPPCAEALIKAGIKKVCIALQDPDPRVRGRGIKMLREAGIEVIVGIKETEVAKQLAPYLHHRKKHLPYVCLKIASSIDGCIAAKDKSSKWITGPESRDKVHELRAQSDAIIVGASTAQIDQPSLTVRGFEKEHKAPLRVVLDRTGKLKPSGPLFDMSLAPTWIFTSHSTSSETILSWEKMGAKVIKVASDEDGLHLEEVLKVLAEASIMQVLVEGGGKLLGSFIKNNLYQKLYVFIGSKFLGDGVRSFSGLSIPSIDFGPKVKLASVSQSGEDACLEYDHLNHSMEVV